MTCKKKKKKNNNFVMSQEQQQNLSLKENRKDEVDKNTTDKPWIIVFEGLSDEKKARLINYTSGFYISDNLLTIATIKPDDLDRGFVNTGSSWICQFHSNQMIKPKPQKDTNYRILV